MRRVEAVFGRVDGIAALGAKVEGRSDAVTRCSLKGKTQVSGGVGKSPTPTEKVIALI